MLQVCSPWSHTSLTPQPRLFSSQNVFLFQDFNDIFGCLNHRLLRLAYARTCIQIIFAWRGGRADVVVSFSCFVLLVVFFSFLLLPHLLIKSYIYIKKSYSPRHNHLTVLNKSLPALRLLHSYSILNYIHGY